MKQQIHDTIFGTHTRAGKVFDVALIITIIASVTIVLLDSVSAMQQDYHGVFFKLEFAFTLLFTAEYLVRLWVSPKPKAYATSFYGVIDLVALIPGYVAIFFPGATYLMIVRLLRVLRIFRIFKLFRYLREANVLIRSLAASKRKVTVFFFCITVIIVIFGSLMYLIEGAENGFTSIPKSIYWAIVTVTTVGYGDISPQTPLGQAVASLTMLVGYAILAVPTGIITAELAIEINKERLHHHCLSCDKTGHEPDAKFCKFCGSELPELQEDGPAH
ncbi:ion transporter [Motilimonas pumila]|uniref:Ion transporter n=1 Tax=Motilimonas pumila TaxID=2303987 RepID=A0A418YDF9_9GAMM|nr:ion transporter [Motilimonas pumila]RJG42562.1 ion transporter [Motilimonas pumila]